MKATIKHIGPWLAGAAAIGALGLAPVASAAGRLIVGFEDPSRCSPSHFSAAHSRMDRIRWCPPTWAPIPRCRMSPAWIGPSETPCGNASLTKCRVGS
jgi:hypothetical protein